PYTLSLHDALPIYRGVDVGPELVGTQVQGGSGLLGFRLDAINSLIHVSEVIKHLLGLLLQVRDGLPHLDRIGDDGNGADAVPPVESGVQPDPERPTGKR